MNPLATAIVIGGSIAWGLNRLYTNNDTSATVEPTVHIGSAPQPVEIPPATPEDLGIEHPVTDTREPITGWFAPVGSATLDGTTTSPYVKDWTTLTNRVDILWREREERLARRNAMKNRMRNGPPSRPFRVKGVKK